MARTLQLSSIQPYKRLATDLYDDCARLRIFGYTFPFPVVWFRETLRRKLTASDLFVEENSQNEQTRLLLGSAITRFGGKHLGYRQNQPQKQVLCCKLGFPELMGAVEGYNHGRQGLLIEDSCL